MTNISIVLDINYEDSIQEIHEQFEGTSITVEILQAVGPAGGLPECLLEGPAEDIREWLLENYCDADDVDYYMYGE